MLYQNGFNLFAKAVEFINSSKKLYIFTPYIKVDALKVLISQQTESINLVVVRWQPRDIITGSSDLEIYPYLKGLGITLYRNPRLHLKAFVDEYTKAFIGSANISQKAINYPETSNYNYELATVVENLTLEDRLYFNTIEAESLLITDNIYEQFQSQLAIKREEFPQESDFKIKLEYPDKNFLISSLPMTYSVETLYRIYETHESIHEVELNCAMHDLALYKIPLGLTLPEFEKQLKLNFFAHPFIRAFLNTIDTEGEIYFGRAKDWIHRNCSNVPVPRKWEITENIQILYRWIAKLSNGVYAVDQPNHSERLFLKLNDTI